MTIYEFLNTSGIHEILEKQLETIQNNRKVRYSKDEIKFITQQFIDPENVLKNSFSKIISIDVQNKSMVEIYDIIKSFFTDEVLFITNWDIPRNTDKWAKKDKLYSTHIDNKIDNWSFNTKTEEFYTIETYYEMNKTHYDNKTFFQIIDEFKSFENYHGYLIDKTKIESFENYMEFKNKMNADDTLIKNFQKSVIGCFSGVHEYEILFVILK